VKRITIGLTGFGQCKLLKLGKNLPKKGLTITTILLFNMD